MSAQGALAGLLMLAWVLACIVIAVLQAKDTPEQKHRHPVEGQLDPVDMGQQSELDRLTRVDKQTDQRLDLQGYLLWALLALNGIGAIAQVAEWIRGLSK